MQEYNFAVFILTHGRPDNVKTIPTLKKCGYTGNIYFIVDDEDKIIDKYIENYGVDKVKIFNKKYYADLVDEGNNFDERRTITHARNACFDIAKQIGVEYFVQLDDDYQGFYFKALNKDGTGLVSKPIKNLDKIFNIFLNFYSKLPFTSIAFAQGGDFIGGITNGLVKNGWTIRRKCMNSFFCCVNRPFQFIGGMNEDVNTYCTLGSRGVLFGTIPLVFLTQTATQSNKGGITDMYLRYGSYSKAFTTVMMHPSSVSIVTMPSMNHTGRLHHRIKWGNTTPLILRQIYKK